MNNGLRKLAIIVMMAFISISNASATEYVVNCSIYSQGWGSLGAWQIALNTSTKSAYAITIGKPNAWTGITGRLLDKKLPLEERTSAQGERFFLIGNTNEMFAINRDTMKFKYGSTRTGNSEWGNCRIAPNGM